MADTFDELHAVLEKRADLTERVNRALDRHDRESVLSIICSWMSLDQIADMLETLEK